MMVALLLLLILASAFYSLLLYFLAGEILVIVPPPAPRIAFSILVAIILSVSTAGIAIQKAPALFGAERSPIEDYKWRGMWVYVARGTSLSVAVWVLGHLSIGLVTSGHVTAEEAFDELLHGVFLVYLWLQRFCLPRCFLSA